MPSDAIAKMQEYKNTVMSKAEKLIKNEFPEKIMELNGLLANQMFTERNFSQLHQEFNIPFADAVAVNNHVTTATNGATGNGDQQPLAERPRSSDADGNHGDLTGPTESTLKNGSVPCNTQLCDMINVVKPIIRKMAEDSNLLKMWISFLIPKIEDGNNFGVDMQEETLLMIERVERQARHFSDQILHYFMSRAQIISKYSHVDECRRAVMEVDEKAHFDLWLIVGEIRNRYSSLHDLIIKNIEKLKKPRSSHSESLY